MSKYSSNPPQQLPQQHRLMLTGLMLCVGAIGITWACLRFAAANHADPNLAFLEEFSEQQELLAAELEVAHRRARSAAKTTPVEPTQPVRHAVEPQTGSLPTESTPFYHSPLKIDLSPTAIEQRLKRDVEYLASDELEGRGIRTRGLEIAGDYLAKEFSAAGLNLSWFDGTPFQEFQLLNGSRKGAVQRVLFNRPDGEKYLLTPNVDFSSLTKTTMGTMTLPVAFAGYGITAPELNYDDYSQIRVAGKAVIMLRHEPRSDDADSPFNGTESSRHAPVYSKIQNAISHGAAAVLLCDLNPSAQHDDSANPFSSELLKVEFAEDAFDNSIPVIHCRRSLLDEVLQQYGADSLSEIQRAIDQDLQPHSFDVEGFRIGFEVTRNRSGRSVRNVLASLEPNGPAPQETVIVGAHYDHLGSDGWGSLAIGANGEIHNGADDNASGTAIIMEVARQLASRRDQLQRRVLFIAFTAEEMGLLGSKHYIRDPVVPLSETIAMINLDMVGRLREEVTVYGVGTAHEWNDILLPAAEARSLRIDGRSSGYGPSDHAVFYERGIPVLHFFTGFHPQYHRPADDAHLLNIEGMRRISECVSEVVLHLATDPHALTRDTSAGSKLFSESGFSELLTPASRPKAKFGVIVKSQEDQQGLTVREVLEESIAAQHGIQPGDVLLQVGETGITSLEALRNSVMSFESGSRVPVRIRRRTLEIELDVEF